eukprot:c9365_g1_i1 orf=162-413(+)
MGISAFIMSWLQQKILLAMEGVHAVGLSMLKSQCCHVHGRIHCSVSKAGCIFADGEGHCLFISDSNHYHIIVADAIGKVLDCE